MLARSGAALALPERPDGASALRFDIGDAVRQVRPALVSQQVALRPQAIGGHRTAPGGTRQRGARSRRMDVEVETPDAPSDAAGAEGKAEELSSYGLSPLSVATVPTVNVRIVAAQGSVIDFTGTAIVNAANEGCISGGGVDGAVSDAGGEALHAARLALPIVRPPYVRCATGDAKTTIGGELLSEWCIHAVGPNYRLAANDDDADMLLYMAYHASMREARKKACRTLAFSLLSAGIFRGRRPLRMVLAIGVLAVHAALYEGLSDVFFVAFTSAEVEAITSVLDELLVQPNAEDARSELMSQLSPQLQEVHQRALDGTLDPPPRVGVAIAAMAITAMYQG